MSFKFLLFVFFVVSMFSACNKTEMQDMEKSISKAQTVEKEALTSKEVSLDYTEINANLEEFAKVLALQNVVNEKFLEFKNIEDFLNKIKELKLKDSRTLDEWEDTNGVITLRRIRESYIEATKNLIDSLSENTKNHSSESIKILTSRIATDVGKSIKAYHNLISFNLEDGIDIHVTDYDYGYVLNSQAVVKIGTSIYQFTEDYVKVIIDGDASKISKLWGINSSDEKNSITVQKVKKFIKQSPYRSGRVEDFSFSCIGTNGNYRLILYEEYTSWCIGYDISGNCTASIVITR